tara:strand:- start:172 stop:384 length:213 start_codon:yes stop_codon:yes gene_type:complete
LGKKIFLKETSASETARQRLDAIMGEGGITDCGNAQVCVEVCPKNIPLTESITDIGRQTSWQMIKNILIK